MSKYINVNPQCLALFSSSVCAGDDVTPQRSAEARVMNSVTPSSAQYARGGALHNDHVDGKRTPSPSSPQVPETKGHLSNGIFADGAGEPDEVDKLKLKLMSAWNNVKYGTYYRVER